MINVMLDPLPSEWNGYEVNTDFRVGMQVYILAVSYTHLTLPTIA